MVSRESCKFDRCKTLICDDFKCRVHSQIPFDINYEEFIEDFGTRVFIKVSFVYRLKILQVEEESKTLQPYSEPSPNHDKYLHDQPGTVRVDALPDPLNLIPN